MDANELLNWIKPPKEQRPTWKERVALIVIKILLNSYSTYLEEEDEEDQ